MILEQEISFFSSQTTKNDAIPTSIGDALDHIRDCESIADVEEFRKTGDENIKRTRLPAVAFHGQFDGSRTKSNFHTPSGVIIVDIDDVEGDLEQIKSQIMSEFDSCLACMISPSNDGIKALYLVEPETVDVDTYRLIGRDVGKKFTKYGKIDTLSVTDCLLMTADKKILVNSEAIPDIYIRAEKVKKKTYKLGRRDETKEVFDDPEEFFETVLFDSIAEKSDSNYHFLQMALFDLAKFGFTHKEHDLEFVIGFSEVTHKVSKSNSQRFLEAATKAAEYPQTEYPYKFGGSLDGLGSEFYDDYMGSFDKDEEVLEESTENDDFDDVDLETFGLIDYSDFMTEFWNVANEGDRAGMEISLKNWADIFRFSSGLTTVTGIPGHGKASRNTAKVYTPTGYKLMGDIKVGDEVLTKGGKTNVLGVFPQGKQPIYEVEFSDGSKTQCTKDHLWLCNSTKERKNRKAKVVGKTDEGKQVRSYTKSPKPMKTRSLGEIMDTYIDTDGRYKYNIPLEAALFSEKKIPIHPYLLGVLIGDGSMSRGCVKFTNQNVEILSYIEPMLEELNCCINKVNRVRNTYEVIFSKKSGLVNQLSAELRDMGLCVKSLDKFIPDDYIYNSIENRLDLLRGLMDTDGYIDKSNCISYSTSSKKLRDGVVTLVQSLGGVVKLWKDKYSTYFLNGETITSKNANYNMSISLPNDYGNLFTNNKKRRDRWRPKKENPKRFIKNINYVCDDYATCILVEDESHLYLTDEFIVTHNTEFVDQCILDLARLHGVKTVVAGFEQREHEHVGKMVRKLIGYDFRAEGASKEGVNDAAAMIVNYIKHVDVTKVGGDIVKIIKIFENAHKVHGVTNFVIDPFNLLSIKSRSSGHEKVAEILQRIVIFCKKFDVSVLLVAHPTKMAKDEKTKKYLVPDFYSVKGSSAFFEMSYHGFVVYRDDDSEATPIMVRNLKVKQNNLGERGKSAFFRYIKGSGRYVPVDSDGYELQGDHKDRDWLEKFIQKDLELNK